MTALAIPTPQDTAAASRDLQRRSLDEIVTLSVECAAQERLIDQRHDEALALENARFKKAALADRQRHERRVEELADNAAQRQANILSKHEAQRQAVESASEAAQQRLATKREEDQATLKKQVEQALWLAESVLEAVEAQADVDDRKAKADHETRLGELTSLEESIQAAMARYNMEMTPVNPPLDDVLKRRLAAEPRAVLAENHKRALDLLQEIEGLSRTSVVAGMVPWLIVIVAAVAGAVGWVLPHDGQTRFIAAGGAAVGALLLGVVLYLFHRSQERGRMEANAEALYTPLMESMVIARLALRVDSPEARAAAREHGLKEARRKGAAEVNVVREKVKPLQAKAAEQHRAAVAEEAQRRQDQLLAADREKEKGLEELEHNRSRKARQIEEEETQIRREAEAQHTATLEKIESDYASQCAALTARWEQGLRGVSDLLESGSGIDPHLINWDSPEWERWKSPAAFSGQVRFGEMKVDLAQLTEQVPARLRLPETFSVPAMLTFPAYGSLLVETDHAGRPAGIAAAQMVMARLLTQMPAGRCKFTLFDPVGLGQSFAGFMHLADHDESLVGSRIWTEREHMEQRLADLTEHMETVIQKYLRNEYATIDQYNAQAGELAEPVRFLVIADFPTGFETESLRRLTSIATTGPRCGVYTIILRDTRQDLPTGSRMDEIIARSVHLRHKNGAFTWDDEVFKKFPLRVDAPPDEAVLTGLMDLVGRAAKEAKRVEVPFASIAPPRDQFWTMSSKSDLRVPIGKSGATRLQSLRLGVGVAQHTLVAGKTGSGKSNLMHTIVTNLAMWYSPDEVEFYLVDFKKGVEFKAYASSQLPHARAIAVESDREFGLSVLQRVDAELTRRGAMFRDVGAQEISGFRDRTGKKLPRTILLIDEFQEFFSEDDKLAQEASVLLDRLVRQGRAFGVHVVLGSQSIGGSSGLARSTLGQIAVRVALQCSEADSQMILGDNNSAARLLTRPGEAVYNDAGGLVEANSPFQIAFLPDDQRSGYLEHVRELSQARGISAPAPIIFEGNTAAAIRKNSRLMGLLDAPAYPAAASSVLAYVGEPVAIKEPTAIPIRRQSGGNVLMVGQQEESAIAIFASMAASIAAQQKPGEAIFYLMDGTPADSHYFGMLERVLAALPNQCRIVGIKEVPQAVNELATMMARRQGEDAQAGPAVYLLMFGLQRYRLLRHQEDDFSFSKSDEPAAPKPDKQFAELLSEGPGLGLHSIIWADAPITLERTLDRGSMRQFDHRILFQMSATDSSNLIDSPLANRLGNHRALLYSEEQGTLEKYRPYEMPDEAWLELLARQLKGRQQ